MRLSNKKVNRRINYGISLSILFFFCSALGADIYKQIESLGVKHYQEIRDTLDGEWDLLFFETAEQKTLKVYSGIDKKFLFEDVSPSNRFIKAEGIELKNSKSPLLLTLWTRGVHAYEIKIYDPKKANKTKQIPLLFNQTSDFMIDWMVQDKVLHITVDLGEVDSKTGQRKRKVIQWAGSK